jgi:ABC-2 type transport system ATP-binding protein
VAYGPNVAVRGLSLEVREGELLGLLGPNGAGKSSTLSCVAGLIAPTSGSVEIAGIDAVAHPRAARAKLGVVPQALALYEGLTVRQNLRLFGALFGLSGRALRARVDWGLALSQLEANADARAATLSGGMKRRLNIACALLHDPPLVLCDEPTTGVDPQSRNHIFETLRALHAAGKTLVYTTHYMEEVVALCKRVAIIDRGSLVALDDLNALLTRGGGPRELRVRAAEACSQARVKAALASAGIDAVVEPVERSLEDVFLELTGRALRDD